MLDSKTECYLTGTSILCWLILFSAGLVVSSNPYLEQLKVNFTIGSFFIAALVYTPSNIALLSVLSGFIGGCISRVIGVVEIDSKIEEARVAQNDTLLKNLERRKSFLLESPVVSMFRGFLTYIGIISGVLLLVYSPFKNTDPEQYIRIAGLVSGIAFIMGYDPTKFEELISQFSQWKPNKS
jgi:hypothetical protein